jgi:hypothetical protein
MPQKSLNASSQLNTPNTVRFDDLIAEVPAEWRDRFRAFVERGEDPNDELLRYLDEQFALPESSRSSILRVFDQATGRSFEPLRELGAAFKRADEKLSTPSDGSSRPVGTFDDLIAQVPSEWRDRFRAFLEKGEDPNGELIAYIDEQAALPESSRGVILTVFDQAFSRSLAPLRNLGCRPTIEGEITNTGD